MASKGILSEITLTANTNVPNFSERAVALLQEQVKGKEVEEVEELNFDNLAMVTIPIDLKTSIGIYLSSGWTPVNPNS